MRMQRIGALLLLAVLIGVGWQQVRAVRGCNDFEACAWRLAIEGLRVIGEAHAAPLVPALVRTLRTADWDSREWAARSLGRSGSRAAVAPLIDALGMRSFLIQRAAIDALGWLGPSAREALPALDRVASDHWLKPLRAEAAAAAGAIRTGHVRLTDEQRPHLFGRCPRMPWSRAVSQMTLEVDDGTLVGVDSGEFTSRPQTGLQFHGRDGGSTQLIKGQNVHVLMKAGENIFAFTGLSHMGLDHGRVWKIARGRGGHWAATEWVELLAKARGVEVGPSGELKVCTSSGSMRVALDGTIAYLGCAVDCGR
jgi:hypothetical protein